MKMKYLALVFALFASAAGAQQLVNCAPLTPCTLSGPANTGTGDQAWYAFGKVNGDISTLWTSILTSPDGSISFGGTLGAGATAEVNASNISTGVLSQAHGGTGGTTSIICGHVNEQAVSSYTVLTTDNCNVVAMNNAFGVGGVVLASAAATGFGPPFRFTIVNQNVKFPISVIPNAGSIIFNGGSQTELWMQPNTSCDFSSDGTNWETSACTTTLSPTGVGNPLQTVNSYGNTIFQYLFNALSTTSSTVSFGTTVSGSYVGAPIVVSGCGSLVGTAPITVTGGGTGYVVGDQVTMTNGLVLKVTWVSGGVVQAISGTNNRAGVEVYGNGVVSAWPGGGAFTQVSTTGSGTGLAVTMTEAALPLATTVASGFTGGTTVPLTATCSQTQTSVSGFVAIGNSDNAGITAAQNTGAASVVLPSNHTYGITSPITWRSSSVQSIDCQGSTIVALGSMAEMITASTNGGIFQANGMGGVLRNCVLEGMGIATLNVLQGADWVKYDHVALKDATQANLEVNVVGGGGTVAINSSYDLQINNQSLLVPNEPIYCVWMANTNATDNQFLPGEIWNGCQQAGVYDQTFSTFYTGVHIYGVYNGPDFLMAGGSYTMTGVYADNPVGSYCGIQLNSSNSTVTGWKTYIASSYNTMNQSGICNGATATGNTITTGNWLAPSSIANNGCVNSNSGTGAVNTIFGFNANCALQNPQTPAIFGFNSATALTGSGATQYCNFGAQATCQSSSNGAGIIFPIGGAIQNLWVNTVGDIGSANTYVVSLSTSSGSPTITCTITGTGSGNDSCNDLFLTTGHSFVVSAGETAQLKIVTSGSATGRVIYGGLEMLTYH